MNYGKDFEQLIRTAFEKQPNTSVIRLIDPQNGYAGVRNICDFVIYNYPNQYLIECKSCRGKSLPMSNITDNQWKGLLEMSSIKGVVAGYMIWFIDCDITIFVPAAVANEILQSGRKSISKDIISDSRVIVITAKKKRVFFEYDMTEFIRRHQVEDREMSLQDRL